MKPAFASNGLPRGMALAVALAAAWALTAALPAQAAEFRVGPKPDWVLDIAPELDAPVPTAQISGGVYYLLTDTQDRAGPRPVSFARLVTKVTDSGGLVSAAHVEIGFDPSYQTLTLHWVDVIRDGQHQARLANTPVKVIQREEELEYRIYDGRKTATLFLDDVRVGDVVDYAYSVQGANPAFGGAIFGGVTLQWDVPVHDDHTRLLVPRGTALQVSNRNGAPAPSRSSQGDYDELVWRQANVAPRAAEGGTPGWFDDFPSVQWSQYPHWGSVVDWAVPMYLPQDQLGDEADAELARIERTYASNAERTAAVLRFVQSQIRYLSVVVGVGSHRPTPPQRVLERRFGDCKDKTLLMLSMLHRLDIPAQAALVHTEVGRGLLDQLPTPGAFDHVLVKVRLAGRDYWLDPTRDTQFGSLGSVYQPDFGQALVLARGVRALVPMRLPGQPSSKREVHTQFDTRGGMDRPARMTVRTTNESGAAEYMRGLLAREPHESIQKGYLNFYASDYPGIVSAGPLEVEDDRDANRLVTIERYDIAIFWAKDAKTGVRTAVADAADMRSQLDVSKTPIRRAPMALEHPVDFTHITEILLRDAWSIEDSQTSVSDPGFRFDQSVRSYSQGRRVVVVDRYRSLADHVPAKAMAGYLRNLQQAREELGFKLIWPADAERGHAAGVNWTVALLSLLLLVVFTAAALYAFRTDPPPPSGPIEPALAGLRGWLLLPALGAVVAPLLLMADLVTNLDAYTLPGWSALSLPGGEAYHPLWIPVLLFELAAKLGLLVFSILLLVMYFQRRRGAPRLFICLLAASLAYVAIHLALLHLIPDAAAEIGPRDWGRLASAAVLALIWVPYFMRSRRVRSTFTRTSGPPPLPVAGPSGSIGADAAV
ncbi:MAG: DUF3857 domain-containing protein [Pseudoxanthomonas sp.]|nr:DUF3857 domain-containing protein [Pseudoxanthomonas sp.]